MATRKKKASKATAPKQEAASTVTKYQVRGSRTLRYPNGDLWAGPGEVIAISTELERVLLRGGEHMLREVDPDTPATGRPVPGVFQKGGRRAPRMNRQVSTGDQSVKARKPSPF